MISDTESFVKNAYERKLLVDPGTAPTFALYVSYGMSDCIWTPASSKDLWSFLEFSKSESKEWLFADLVVSAQDYGKFHEELARWVMQKNHRHAPHLYWDHAAHQDPSWAGLDLFLERQQGTYLDIRTYLQTSGYDSRQIWTPKVEVLE